MVSDGIATASVVICPHREHKITFQGLLFMRCLVVGQVEGRSVLCSLTNNMQDMNPNYHISQVERRNLRNLSINIPSSCLHLLSLFLPNDTHRQHSDLSHHHVSCAKQCLSFPNTPDNLYHFVLSLWAAFRYMQLYHNTKASDVYSFSIHSNGTKGQPERKGESLGKEPDIRCKLTPVIRLGQYEAVHLTTHPWTHMDIQCLWRQG